MRILLSLLLWSWWMPVNGQNFVQEAAIWKPAAIEQKGAIQNAKTPYYILNQSVLESKLIPAPHRTIAKPFAKKTVISFPLPSGDFQTFLIQETNNLHPDLAKKYPAIKAYVGESVTSPKAFIHFAISPKGFSGMIQSREQDLIFIDNLTSENKEVYKVYHKKELKATPFACEVHRINKTINFNPTLARGRAGDCQLRTFRLALACTGEYTEYHGGTTADALAAMNNTLSIINGIYEQEIAVNFQLIPNTTDLIFLNPSTDPYTNDDLGDMLGENQSVCNTRIGAANYDIGHVFSTALGGVAFLGVVCDADFKAGGATGFVQPEGPIFAIDLVSHEIGHQLGAEHTFNGDEAACSGSNRNNETAVEPGSGSTIMGYAGICDPQNIQDNSDPYFHAISLEQMHRTLNRTDCAVQAVNFNNTAPFVANTTVVYTIPPSTPFVLSLNATDEESSQLTYNWEQMDNEIAHQPPRSDNRGGPLFRGFRPSNSPSRYFPNLVDLAQNNSSIWEVLPSVRRAMNFRGTVRDNQLNGGCTSETDIEIQVTDDLPFRVLSPNNRVIWEAGTEKNITWEVGNTHQNPINLGEVDILLSMDAGLTYPIELAKNAPNTGEGIILVPNMVTTKARIMVKAVDNIFFDISNENFEITKPDNDFDIDVSANQTVCSPTSAVYEIELSAIGNFIETVELSLTNLPEVVTATFSNTTPSVPSTVLLTIDNLTTLSGAYVFNLIVNGSTGEKTRTLNLNVAPTTPTQPIPNTPINKAGNTTTTPAFVWNLVENASNYLLEIAESSTFENPILSINNITDTTFQVEGELNNDTAYFWRVKANNACGESTFSDIFTFKTLNETCAIYEPMDLPLTISPIFRTTVTSEITIPEKGKILSVQLKNVQISHSFISDLVIELQSPQGTRIKLVDKVCGGAEDLKLNFDSEANLPYVDLPCPPTNETTIQPLESLAQLNGTEMQGVWRLIISDVELLDGGALEDWALELCYQVQKPLAFQIHTKSVSCAGGNDGAVGIIPDGGTGEYQYLWSNEATTVGLESLKAGIYGVTLSDGENTIDTTLIIEEPLPLSLNLIKDKSGCIGENNGAVISNVFGGTGAYQYQWSNGLTTPNLNQIPTGEYALVITDSLGCTIVDSIAITAFPFLELAIASQVNPYCTNDSIGRISIISSKEMALVDYQWSNGLIGGNQDSLPAGNYTVTATDSNGCQEIVAVAIEQNFDETLPVLNLTTPTIYLDENGVGELAVSAIDAGSFDDCGVLDLTLSQTLFDCQNVGIQNVLVTGIDAAGNEANNSTNVIIVDTIAPVFNCFDTIQIVGCQDITENNYPTAIDNCGTVNVQLLQEGEAGFVNDSTILSFRAADGNGNEQFCYVPLVRIVELTAVGDAIAPTCADGNDGAATLFISGGQGPYTYLWNDTAQQTTSVATGLASGEYEVRITDNTGCVFIEKVNILAREPITVMSNAFAPTCVDGTDGAVAINTSGGEAPYTYVWSDPLSQTTSIATDLTSGDYEVTIRDNAGCIFVEKVNVQAPDPITIMDTAIVAEINGLANGSIEIAVAGGIGNLQPVWFKEDTIIGIDFLLDSLEAGTYQVNITDENGCKISQTFQVDMLTNTTDLSFVEKVTIYPNPTSNIFTLDVELFTKKHFSICVFNLLGEVIFPEIDLKSKNGSYQFDLTPFENGVYFVKLEVEAGILTKPIILLK